MEESLLTGKSPLLGGHPGADLSGLDFNNVYASYPMSLSESFLNGISVSGGVFLNIAMDQVELAESTFDGCNFINVNCNGSDFVGSEIKNSTFTECSFSFGEWRNSTFENVVFIECTFDSATINLCVFRSCQFSKSKSNGFGGKAINYNVFEDTRIDSVEAIDHMTSNNFGLIVNFPARAILSSNNNYTLNDLCLQSSRGVLDGSEIVAAINWELNVKNNRKIRKLKLEFISNIINSISRKGMISYQTLIKLEEISKQFAINLSEESDLLLAMKIVLSTKSAIHDVYVRICEIKEDEEFQDLDCKEISLFYQHSYSLDEIDILVRSIGIVACQNPEALMISNFRNGSTFVELVASTTIQLSSVLVACALLMRQATATIQQATKLKKAFNEFREGKNVAKRKTRPNVVKKVPALSKDRELLPEMANVKSAIRESGNSLVFFDKEANIVIRPTPTNQSMETVG